MSISAASERGGFRRRRLNGHSLVPTCGSLSLDWLGPLGLVHDFRRRGIARGVLYAWARLRYPPGELRRCHAHLTDYRGVPIAESYWPLVLRVKSHGLVGFITHHKKKTKDQKKRKLNEKYIK